MRILIFGLPGSGKTTLAHALIKLLPHCAHLNADQIRKSHNDWDFSPEGRLRQAERMRQYADQYLSHDMSPYHYVVADFVAPLPEYRQVYDADFSVFMDTIKEGRFEDTNRVWFPPSTDEYDMYIDQWREPDVLAKHVHNLILKKKERSTDAR